VVEVGTEQEACHGKETHMGIGVTRKIIYAVLITTHHGRKGFLKKNYPLIFGAGVASWNGGGAYKRVGDARQRYHELERNGHEKV